MKRSCMDIRWLKTAFRTLLVTMRVHEDEMAELER
jgi:hypothetical protein